ncbi:CRISPR-associated endonuclease Cas2 [Thiocapsa imhoffii]|uniref:CRISPR-associated endoribonuclease Cas2 n=1 Tax=Thiocapsa imhoffii TaxID=382777 RepID=A0A9X0WIK9_9GAMM|nr:CRISPR-associated endonuclease Cas2 [Thiocapsa imhoffii]MBK1645233.1 CRISPR-associated endonuclease Cas2 [Thiocapsa imhoffii]
MPRQAAVIAYDIRCDRRRRRVARCLQRWRLDGQYSLFECRLTQAEARELFLQLVALIDGSEDALLLAWMDPTRSAEAVTRGARIGFQSPSLYLA